MLNEPVCTIINRYYNNNNQLSIIVNIIIFNRFQHINFHELTPKRFYFWRGNKY